MNRESVLYIPMDDRPPNCEFIEKFSGISRKAVEICPKDYLGKFLKRGCRNNISQWLLSQENKDLIVSLDMLLYGGLVASRKIEASLEEALYYSKKLKEYKSKNPQCKIYAFNNIMRLSISVEGSDSQNWWEKVNLYNEYRYKYEVMEQEEYKDKLDEVIEHIPEEVLKTYLEARERNHKMNVEAITLVKDGIIDFLILSQEDCSPYGLHIKEHAILNNYVNEYELQHKIFIYPGADEIGQILFTRYINDYYRVYPKIYIKYDCEEGANNVPKFEDRPLRVNVEEHVRSLGINKVESIEESDFILAITTPHVPHIDMMEEERKEYNKQSVIEEFTKELKVYVDSNRIVALADLSYANGGDEYLINGLRDKRLLFKLSAYSAWNTAGNALGTALCEGNIISSLQIRGLLDEESKHKNRRFLIERYLDDFLYQSIVRTVLSKEMRRNNLNEFNMGSENREIERFMNSILMEKVKEYFPKDHDDYIGLHKVEAVLPWDRAFEIGFNSKEGCGDSYENK